MDWLSDFIILFTEPLLFFTIKNEFLINTYIIVFMTSLVLSIWLITLVKIKYNWILSLVIIMLYVIYFIYNVKIIGYIIDIIMGITYSLYYGVVILLTVTVMILLVIWATNKFDISLTVLKISMTIGIVLTILIIMSNLVTIKEDSKIAYINSVDTMILNEGIRTEYYINQLDYLYISSNESFAVSFEDNNSCTDTIMVNKKISGEYLYSKEPKIKGKAVLYISKTEQKIKYYLRRHDKDEEKYIEEDYTASTYGIYELNRGDTLRIVSDNAYQYKLGHRMGMVAPGDTLVIALYDEDKGNTQTLTIMGSGIICQKIYVYGYNNMLRRMILGIGIGYIISVFLISKLLEIIIIKKTKVKYNINNNKKRKKDINTNDSDIGRDTLEKEMVDIEKNLKNDELTVSTLMTHLQESSKPRSMWESYKLKKQNRHTSENIAELRKIVIATKDYLVSGTEAISAYNKAVEASVRQKNINNLAELKVNLEKAIFNAEIAEAKLRQSEAEKKMESVLYDKDQQPEPKPKPKPTEEQIQAKREKTAEKREKQEEIWDEELTKKGWSREDIAHEVERRRRARGWD